MPWHRRKYSGTERLPVATQADGMAFYRWKSKGYHGGAYIDIWDESVPLDASSSEMGRMLVEMLFVFVFFLLRASLK